MREPTEELSSLFRGIAAQYQNTEAGAYTLSVDRIWEITGRAWNIPKSETRKPPCSDRPWNPTSGGHSGLTSHYSKPCQYLVQSPPLLGSYTSVHDKGFYSANHPCHAQRCTSRAWGETVVQPLRQLRLCPQKIRRPTLESWRRASCSGDLRRCCFSAAMGAFGQRKS
ncbi:uncharacterized protein BDZ99DRAFT_173143 [Mytilinidion resinicola]|uniref:Uncharacterized protein n=1 Tax=Mytilinidion resinicola TaxID=574789 RepID=A0A6A6Y5X1_9PEZI|nr:uncharacterized protein BDZ99DRAFT_173143 [Mytilinidion resinicola]KAF2803424.1 hypothetical protein BDZ99DRAFT_173143 [Mytilinidion resinicola]